MVGGEVHNAISTLCSGWVTENVEVERSAEPFVAHWDGEMQINHQKETC